MTDDIQQHPALAMIDHGKSRMTTARTTSITNAYDSLSNLMAMASRGEIPARFMNALGEWADQVAEAAENNDPIPSLGSGGSSKSEIKPEYRNVMRLLDNGTYKLDSRGMIELPEPDESQVDDILKPIEQSLGLTVIASAPAHRRGAILDAIGELNDSGSTSTGNNGLIDMIGQAAGVTRPSGNDDKAYAERIATTVGSNKQDLDNILGDLEHGSDVKKKPQQSVFEYYQQNLEDADAPAKAGKSRRGWGGRS